MKPLQTHVIHLKSSDDTTSLAPDSQFSGHAKDAICLSQAIDICTTLVVEQPDFDYLDGVPNLQRHQKDSKATSDSWRSEVRTELFRVNDSIISYTSQFNEFYGDLCGFADAMAKDPEARANLIAGLQELKKEIAKQKHTAGDVSAKLNNFLRSMMTHKSDLSSDATQIDATYTGDTGKLADIKASIDAYSDAMRSDLTMMAAGSTGVVVGALTVAVGVGLWIESAGGSTPVILAGILVIGGGSAAIGIGAKDYSETSQKKAALLKELSSLKSEIAVAQHLQTGVQDLVGHIDTIVQATDKLYTAWGQLERDYDSLIEALNSSDPQSVGWIVKKHLAAAKTQWNILADDANTLKKNFLTPPNIDVNSLKFAKPGMMCMPTLHMANLFLPSPVRAAPVARAILPQPPVALTKNTQLKNWVEQTNQELYSFEHSLQAATSISSAPADVISSNSKLVAYGDVAGKSAGVFLSDIETLSAFSSVLKTTAAFPDAAIVVAGIDAFRQLASKLSVSRNTGSTAVSDFGHLSQAQMETSAGINGWLNRLKSDKESDEQQIAEFEKQRDEAEREKERSKQDFWWCFLGPIACAVVAIEQSQKVNAANAKIRAISDQLSGTEKSLSSEIATWTTVSTLGSVITALSHDIDGILKALQMLEVSVDGITASYDSATPFIIRAHLKADADQLEGIDGSRLRATSRAMKLVIMSQAVKAQTHLHVRGMKLLKSSTLAADEPTALDVLQQMTTFTMNIQSAAKLISSQPRLVYVENLLKQDQELLAGHSLDWLLTYSTKIVSILSRINGLGSTIGFLAPSIHDFISKSQIPDAVEGLDSICTDLTRFSQFLFETKTVSRQFLVVAKDDQYRFISVSNVLRDQLTGDKGELRRLEAQEASLSSELTSTLEDVVNASTKLLVRELEWGLVLGVTLAFGQIEFAAVEGAVLMNVVKEKANVAIKFVSSVGTKKAAAQLMTIEQSQDKVTSIVEQRGETLAALAKLSVDIATLHILVQSVNAFDNNADQLLKSLDSVTNFVSNEITNFYAIKLILQSGKTDEALKRLDEAAENWKSITMASSLLQQTFNASF